MAMEFRISDSGTPQIVGNLLIKTGDKATKGMRPVMKSIFVDMLLANEANIRSGGRRGGGSYKQLTEQTLKKKGSAEILYTRGSRPGYKKIQGDDLLVTSVTQYKRKYQIMEITDKNVTLGTLRPYAGAHQYGVPSRKIPRRPFLAYTQKDVDKWNRQIRDHLMAGIEQR